MQHDPNYIINVPHRTGDVTPAFCVHVDCTRPEQEEKDTFCGSWWEFSQALGRDECAFHNKREVFLYRCTQSHLSLNNTAKTQIFKSQQSSTVQEHLYCSRKGHLTESVLIIKKTNGTLCPEPHNSEMWLVLMLTSSTEHHASLHKMKKMWHGTLSGFVYEVPEDMTRHK